MSISFPQAAELTKAGYLYGVRAEGEGIAKKYNRFDRLHEFDNDKEGA